MEKRYEDFTEVWGDTVNLKEMFISILIGATVSITVYILAKFFLTQLGVDKKLLGGYVDWNIRMRFIRNYLFILI